MKTIVIVFAFATAFVTGINVPFISFSLQLHKQYKFTCIDENKPNPGTVKMIEDRKLEIPDLKSPEKCYIYCMLEKNKMVINGNFNLGKMMESMPDDLQNDAKVAYKSCKKEIPKHDCSGKVDIFYCLNRYLQYKHKTKFIVTYIGL